MGQFFWLRRKYIIWNSELYTLEFAFYEQILLFILINVQLVYEEYPSQI